jgi:hypothetical protein
MPVILEPGSENLRTWLDPQRYEWSKELQDLLKPFSGELEVYPVSKEVGKVGNNSPSFVIPIASKENKSNIANFFANAAAKKQEKKGSGSSKLIPEVEIREESLKYSPSKADSKSGEGHKTKLSGTKRLAVDDLVEDEPPKKTVTKMSPKKISATSNGTKSPSKAKQDGTQKITKFFANSA